MRHRLTRVISGECSAPIVCLIAGGNDTDKVTSEELRRWYRNALRCICDHLVVLVVFGVAPRGNVSNK